MFVIAMAPRAQACPHGTVCVAAGTRIATATEIPRPRSMLHVATANLRISEARDIRLDASLKVKVPPKSSNPEMPWIWVTLRKSVYARLPTYEHATRRPENKFSLVLSPVVVSSPQDTVPGVGVEGGF